MDAKKLTRWSNVIAWPGVVLLIFGGAQARRLGGSTAFWAVTILAIVMVLAGATLGEIGKRRMRSEQDAQRPSYDRPPVDRRP